MKVVSLLAVLTALCGVAHGAEVLTNQGVEPTRLQFGSVSLYSENDKYFAGTDRNYTNGFKLSFLSANLLGFTQDPVPRPIQELVRTFGRLVPPGRDYKLGLSVGQNLYTPVDTTTSAPISNDRPYAAWLYGGIAFQVYQPPRVFASGVREVGRLDTLELTLGMVGPAALGRQTQNNIHHLIGVETAHGWQHQIHNEPGLNIGFERKYRFSTPHARQGWGADFIPHVGFMLGNVFTYANAGAEVRGGWKLPADFGTNLIRPSGDSNARRRPPWSVFLFSAVDGRAVARDETIQGNMFRHSAGIGAKPFVGDLLGGLGVGTRHWQFTYAEAVRTHEYVGQPEASVFGSISIAYFY